MAGFRWVADFMGFDESDEAALHAAAPLLAPVVPSLVDAVYQRLFAWASVKRHFVSRQSGCEGALPSDVALLEPEHEMIQFR
ncbi:MAG: protoglobin domain-containing protein, partial [Planctomycetaceae bacterium]